MGWLVPDITKPVTLKLTPAEVQREAYGRILSLAGAGVGILGGVLILRANPALRGAVSAGKGQTITLSIDDAKRSALGKSLALIGTAVGVAGSVMVMSTDPKTKAKFAQTFDSVPAGIKSNKKLLALAGIAALIGGTAYMIRAQNQQLALEYAS